MYARATGIALTAYTDSIYDQTYAITAAEIHPGDIVLYRYNDPSQPGTSYPHVALYLSPTLDLDCRYPQGTGQHARLTGQYQALYRRANALKGAV